MEQPDPKLEESKALPKNPQKSEKAPSVINNKGKKLWAKQAEVYQLRNTFNVSLAKLATKETKEVALAELKKIIEQSTTSEALRIYLSSLSNVDKALSATAKEGQLETLKFIVSTFKESLLDPLDNPPTLLKTVMRVCSITHKYLKENSAQIHNASSEVLLQIYQSCLAKENTDTLQVILYDPLEAIAMSDSNKYAQAGAAKCLHCLFATFKEENNTNNILDQLCPKFVSLFSVKLQE